MAHDDADDLTYSKVSGVLKYEDGDLFWKKTRGGQRTGTKAGCVNKEGYIAICIFGKLRHAHRIVWLLLKGCWPDGQLDHINGDPLDNRIGNLRLCTHMQNQHNRKISKNNKTGFKGVILRPCGKFEARITVAGKVKYLGRFITATEAAEAYDRVCVNEFGVFARPNQGGAA